VAVDDGSTDETAERLHEWQSRYPENIRYVHKENGGLSSARNTGLQYVKTPWVTFIDPDDFINPKYFYVANMCMGLDENLCMLAANIIYFYEDRNEFSNSHPLLKTFSKGVSFAKNSVHNYSNIKLQAASTFFRTEIIKENDLRFEEIKPNFEDAHFICRYLSCCRDMTIAFMREAQYFYRKRADQSSLVDKSWKDKRKYDDLLRKGYLDLLQRVPDDRAVYSIVQYDLMWHLKRFVKAPEKLAFLGEEGRKAYLDALDAIYARIPNWAIWDFNMADCWWYWKVGIIHCFKKAHIDQPQHVYIEAYDPAKNEIRMRYYTGEPVEEAFYVGEHRVLPTQAKTVRDDFCGRTFVCQRIIWLPIGDDPDLRLRVELAGITAGLIIGKESMRNHIPVAEFPRKFLNDYSSPEQKGHWLLMDRDVQADDNAEHLYRWMMKNHPEQEAYFGLRENSHDWERLRAEGFNLLAYGSPEYEEKYRTSAKIISSQVDHYVVNYFDDDSTKHIPFIFLQHGVTQNDLSRWLNGKRRIDLLVTASPAERDSICGDGNRYRYTAKEVRLTGFPRHDALLNGSAPKKEILIMPTWREYLTGKVIMGNERETNPDFMDSLYARSWKGLLCSERLKTLSDKHGYSVVFYPHPNIQQYLSMFELPEYITVRHQSEGSMQTMFRETAMMITDYSSVAFEMAYLFKPVIYFQFDEAEFFRGEHVFQKGYFDCRRNGFGPVAVDQDEVLAALDDILKNDGRPLEEYRRRMEETFAFRDGKCCERVYEAILDLDKPYPPDFVNAKVLREALSLNAKDGKWDIALEQSEELCRVSPCEDSKSLHDICKIGKLVSDGEFGKAVQIGESLSVKNSDPLFDAYCGCMSRALAAGGEYEKAGRMLEQVISAQQGGGE
ncbi:MAG: CDP-glycerol glycerophosphotransferase family protein, partial [Mailhella sp.]|nr:CDP-glycerol glycerophosphotransferase family protein [Mailhella sp.]